VRGELTTAAGHEAHLAYGGLRIDLKPDLKSFELHSFGGRLQTTTLEPPLARQGNWLPFRLVVGPESWTVFIGERKLCEEPLARNADPWLMLHAGKVAGRWTIAARGGVTVPLGRTEPNPFTLGDLGLPHEHIQFGTGTWDPVVGLAAGRRWGETTLTLTGLARLVHGHAYGVVQVKDVGLGGLR
jgi:hypothetical protein